MNKLSSIALLICLCLPPGNGAYAEGRNHSVSLLDSRLDRRIRAQEFMVFLRAIVSNLGHPQIPILVKDPGQRCDLQTLTSESQPALIGSADCFGVREIPRNFEDVFAPGMDVSPDVFALWTPEYLIGQVQPYLGDGRVPLPQGVPETPENRALFERLVPNKYKNPGLNDKLDLQALHDLNSTASKLWTEILECAAGDAESARQLYLMADFPCVSAGNRDLREQLAIFHGEVISFFRTTDIAETFNPNRVPFEKNRPTLELHPLLMEVIEELVAVWFPTESKYGKMRNWAWRYGSAEETIKLSRNIANILPFLSGYQNAPTGLWPTATRAAHTYYRAKFSVLLEPWAMWTSPTEDLFRRMNLFYWVNPLILLIKLYELAVNIRWTSMSVEPAPEVISDQFAAAAGASAEQFRVYGENTRNIVLKFREIAKKYGMERKYF